MDTVLFDRVKLALRVSTDAFDDEIQGIIDAALSDLRIAGVKSEDNKTDPLIIQAVCTYARAHFGDTSDGEYARLKAAYDEQKAQLQIATGYRHD